MNQLLYAMQLAYKNLHLEVHNLKKFPLLTERLGRTYFFEFDRRRITERVDLLAVLEKRERCMNMSQPAIVWDFGNGVQGWEAWNELAGFSVREGMLITKSEGSDPYMASPEIDLDVLTMASVEITMRVIAEQRVLEGQLYWHASSSQDFEPGSFRQFTVNADGDFHTYRVDVVQGALFFGDRVLRLRLDPVNAVADIAIKRVQINGLCLNEQGGQCVCVP